MRKGAIFGVLFILAVLAISGYAIAQGLEQGAAVISQGVVGEGVEGWIVTFSENGENFPMYMSCLNGKCHPIGALELSMEDSMNGNKKCNLVMDFSVEGAVTKCVKRAESSCSIKINECRKYQWDVFGIEFGPKYMVKFNEEAGSMSGSTKIILSENGKVVATPEISFTGKRTTSA